MIDNIVFFVGKCSSIQGDPWGLRSRLLFVVKWADPQVAGGQTRRLLTMKMNSDEAKLSFIS